MWEQLGRPLPLGLLFLVRWSLALCLSAVFGWFFICGARELAGVGLPAPDNSEAHGKFRAGAWQGAGVCMVPAAATPVPRTHPLDPGQAAHFPRQGTKATRKESI